MAFGATVLSQPRVMKRNQSLNEKGVFTPVGLSFLLSSCLRIEINVSIPRPSSPAFVHIPLTFPETSWIPSPTFFRFESGSFFLVKKSLD